MGAKNRTERLASALGASRVADLGGRRSGGPLDLLALRHEVGTRLRSTGGRPTDPAWTVARQVPFKHESWHRLQQLADEVGAIQRRVGPAQLAAILVEHGLEELESGRWAEVLEASRAQQPRSGSEAADAAGITYRQLDAWRKGGLVAPARSEGYKRWFADDEIVRAVWLRSLSSAGVDNPAVRERIRTIDLEARYLVVSNLEVVRTAVTRAELFAVLSEPGAHSVIDQMPLRLRLLGWREARDGASDDQRTAEAL